MALRDTVKEAQERKQAEKEKREKQLTQTVSQQKEFKNLYAEKKIPNMVKNIMDGLREFENKAMFVTDLKGINKEIGVGFSPVVFEITFKGFTDPMLVMIYGNDVHKKVMIKIFGKSVKMFYENEKGFELDQITQEFIDEKIEDFFEKVYNIN